MVSKWFSYILEYLTHNNPLSGSSTCLSFLHLLMLPLWKNMRIWRKPIVKVMVLAGNSKSILHDLFPYIVLDDKWQCFIKLSLSYSTWFSSIISYSQWFLWWYSLDNIVYVSLCTAIRLLNYPVTLTLPFTMWTLWCYHSGGSLQHYPFYPSYISLSCNQCNWIFSWWNFFEIIGHQWWGSNALVPFVNHKNNSRGWQYTVQCLILINLAAPVTCYTPARILVSALWPD